MGQCLGTLRLRGPTVVPTTQPLAQPEGVTGAVAEGATKRLSTFEDIWLPGLMERIASFLPVNDPACSLRLINRATAAQFRGTVYATVHLSQPSPSLHFATAFGGAGALRGTSYQQRQKFLALTAVSGSIPNLQLALSVAGCKPTLATLVKVVETGQLEICQVLHQSLSEEHRDDAGKAMLYAAALHGKDELRKWLFEECVQPWSTAACGAAKGSHWEYLQYVLRSCPDPHAIMLPELAAAAAEGLPLDSFVTLNVAWNIGSVGVERFEFEQVVFQPTERQKRDIMLSAARSSTVDWQDKVQACISYGYLPCRSAFTHAAVHNDALERYAGLEALGFIPEDIPNTVDAVAGYGRLDLLQFLRDRQNMPQLSTAVNAAAAGHLPVLEWLHLEQSPFGLPAALAAAKGGHRNCLGWLTDMFGQQMGLHAPGEARAQLLAAGAESGNLEDLGWLAEHFPTDWTPHIFASATHGGNEAVLEWLQQHGCPMGDAGLPYVIAGQQGDMATLRALRSLGCPWGPEGETFTACVRSDTMCERGVLEWLLQEGCSVAWDEAIDTAMERRGDGELVAAWLQEERQSRAEGGANGAQ